MRSDVLELADLLRSVGSAAGLDEIGVCTADAFDDVRATLHQRRADGLSADMNFTYRNPDRSTDPQRILPGARTIVVGAQSFRRRSTPAESSAPARVGEYVWEPHYATLRTGLDAVASTLRDHGHRAVVVSDDNALVDRAAAHRAGIGWWGKNSNILLVGRGSRFVLGSIVTDAKLPVADGPVEDGCGTCDRCVVACPTEAIVDGRAVDARRCLAWLVQSAEPFPVEFRAALGDRLYGCDECQDVCPPNRTLDRREPAPQTAGSSTVDVVELLQSTDDELIARHGAWYIPRRDPAYLRRNALLVLGNIGDASAPGVRAVIDEALHDTRPVVVSHAIWAATELGLAERVRTVLSSHPEHIRYDPMIVDELDRLEARP